MTTLAELVLKMSADTATLQQDLGKAKQQIEQYTKHAQGALEKLSGFFKLGLAGIGTADLYGQAIARAKEAEEASNRLNAVIKATGSSAGITKRELDEMADAMAASTQFDDEGIRAAAASLLIFKNVQGDTFREALKLSADVAAFFGDEIPAAAAKLGRSLEDPESAFGLLRRAGVVLGEQQKDMIKAMSESGDKAAAQAIILERLKSTFGGVASAMNTGLLKSQNDAKKAWDELLESIGKTEIVGGKAQRTLGGATTLMTQLKAAIDGTDEKKVAELFASLSGFAAEIARAVPFFGPLLQGINLIAQQRAQQSGKRPGEVSGAIRGAVSEEELAAVGALQARIDQMKDAQYVRDKKLAEEAKKKAEEQAKFNENAIKGLEDELIKVQDLTRAQEEMLKIKRGLYGNDKEAQARIVGLAAQVDQAKEYVELLKETKKLTEDFYKNENEQIRRTAELKTESAARIAELEGRSGEAVRIRAAASRFATDDKELNTKLDTVERLTAAQADYNDAQSRAQIIQDQLGNTEARINIDRQFGVASELDGLRRLGEARKRSVEQLSAVAIEMERIARESGNARLIQDAENFRVKLEELAASADVLARKFDEIGQSSFATFITDLTEQTKTFGEAFRDMARSIEREVTRLAAQDIAAKVFGSATKGGGFGGILAGIFGTGSGPRVTNDDDGNALPGTGGFVQSLVSGISGIFGGFRASGGRVDPFHIYGVGEQGMEWFRPDTAGEIVPAGAMGSSVTNVFNIAMPPGTSRETADQMAARMAMRLSRSNARFG